MKRLNLNERFTTLEEVLGTMMDMAYESEDDYELSVISTEEARYNKDTLFVHVTDNNSDDAILFYIKQYDENLKENKKVYVNTICEDTQLEYAICYSNKDELLKEVSKANRIVFNRNKAIFLESIFAEKFSRYLTNEYIFKFDENIDNYKLHEKNESYNYNKKDNEIKLCLDCLFEDKDENEIERRYIYIILKAHEDGKVDLLYMDKYKKRKETLTLDKNALCMLINSYIQN